MTQEAENDPITKGRHRAVFTSSPQENTHANTMTPQQKEGKEHGR